MDMSFMARKTYERNWWRGRFMVTAFWVHGNSDLIEQNSLYLHIIQTDRPTVFKQKHVSG